MLYWMLGVIIFLLSFIAIGSVIGEQEGKDLGVILFGIVLNLVIAAVLGGAYYFLAL